MADNDRISFTRSAADRIAGAVRKVEQGDRDQAGLTFDRVDNGGRKTFRVCTFTGEWSKTAAKVVTFYHQTATPNTVSAVNLFANIGTAAGSRSCAIAKDGTAWYLVAAEC